MNLLRGSDLDRSIILISANTELFKSLKRVLDFENIIPVKESNNLRDYIKNDRDVILFFPKGRDDLYKLLWSELRLNNKKKNPVIALGYYELDSSIDVRDKVFDRLYKSHIYFRIPFDENELLDSFEQLTPLKNLRVAIKKYSDTWGLLVIAFHELRGLLGGEETMPIALKKRKICNLLSQIKELLTIEGRKEIITSLDKIISQIKLSPLNEADCNKFMKDIKTMGQEVLQ